MPTKEKADSTLIFFFSSHPPNQVQRDQCSTGNSDEEIEKELEEVIELEEILSERFGRVTSAYDVQCFTLKTKQEEGKHTHPPHHPQSVAELQMLM